MACPTCSTDRRRTGFGLAEALMASTVLAIAVVGLSVQLSAAHQQAGEVRERNTAVLLARQLLEEIAARPLCDRGATTRLGPETGEGSRTFFDSADDYHRYADDTIDMKDLTGATVPFGGGLKFKYKREVVVEYRSSPAGPPLESGDCALVTVRVKAPGGYQTSISRLMTRHKVQF